MIVNLKLGLVGYYLIQLQTERDVIIVLTIGFVALAIITFQGSNFYIKTINFTLQMIGFNLLTMQQERYILYSMLNIIFLYYFFMCYQKEYHERDYLYQSFKNDELSKMIKFNLAND